MIQSDLQGPQIRKFQRALSGKDNAGIGHTAFGERYLMKTEASVCLAEYVGVSLCKKVGIPTIEPGVVQFRGREVFGSRLEASVLTEEVTTHGQVLERVQRCTTPNVFSAVLALDLALGNPDRHWNNWLYQELTPGGKLVLRAMDFSRAWPTRHALLPFDAHRGENTHGAWLAWGTYGIAMDLPSAREACATLAGLSVDWLSDLFKTLPVAWMSDGPELCRWWQTHWRPRVTKTMDFLEKGAWHDHDA